MDAPKRATGGAAGQGESRSSKRGSARLVGLKQAMPCGMVAPKQGQDALGTDFNIASQHLGIIKNSSYQRLFHKGYRSISLEVQGADWRCNTCVWIDAG